MLRQGGLCEFVIGIDEPRIEPQSVSKLDRRVPILLLGHVLLAGGKVFHLGALRDRASKNSSPEQQTAETVQLQTV